MNQAARPPVLPEGPDMTLSLKLRLPLVLALFGLLFLAAPHLGNGIARADGPRLSEPKGKLLSSWNTAGGAGSMVTPGSLKPAGAVVCLVHGDEVLLDPLSVPYPDNILNESRIGCETLILTNN